MKRSSFPYRPKLPPRKVAESVPLKHKGNETKISPTAWLSDGPVRPIEKGLPIIGALPPSLDPIKDPPIQRFVSLLVDKPYVKEFKKIYGSLADKYPEYDITDPENLSAYEKQFIADNSQEIAEQLAKANSLKVRVQDDKGNFTNKMTTQVPTGAYLQTWGGAISYFDSQIFNEEEKVVEKKKTRRKPKTGLYGEPDPNNPDACGLIREIHFASVDDKEVQDHLTKSDSAQKPLNLGTKTRSGTRGKSAILKNVQSTAVQDCIHTYFTPTGRPFVPRDADRFFPLSLLVANNQTKTPKLDDTSPDSVATKLNLETDPLAECDPRSTLLDTSDQDILFTRDKAPFRRREVATLRAFSAHWEREDERQRQRHLDELRKRDGMVQRAFQSRAAFQTYLELLRQDCQRVNSGLIGKSPFKRKSMWQVALEKAPRDMSSLGERMRFWWRFCAFVRAVGGIREESDRTVANALRALLMENHAVERSLFFNTIENVDSDALGNVAALKLVEFMRIALGIDIDDFLRVLDSRKVSQVVYTQTILSNMSPEQASSMNRIAKMEIQIPDPSELE